MRFTEYIKDKIVPIFCVSILVIFMELFLLAFQVHVFLLVYVPITIILVLGCIFFSEYMRKKHFYSEISNITENLDQKYFIQELLKEPGFIEGKILWEILKDSNKSMIDNVNMYKYKEQDYREYIELWVHEIKTPIASSKLVIENNRNSVTDSIDEELNKIDTFVEQVLYYSRSNNVEKDFIVKKVSLENIVNSVLMKNKKTFINEKISVNLHDLDKDVYSDSKWLEYIINQIISNSIKYFDKDKSIEIYAEQKKDRIVLNIKDNGIGIDKKDINNVFNKGFTGENGRKYCKSTGMGLYICKKLCDKLEHNIGINSVLGQYTNVYITFPISSFVKM